MIETAVPLKINIAAQVLQSGGVIAYPTEAVWGLGCNPNNKNATLQLLSLKGRHMDKGLILVAATIKQLYPYLEGLDPTLTEKLITSSNTGPVTWLVPNNGLAPTWITGKYSTVALRVSTNPIIMQLCNSFGGPIVSTSANLSGESPLKWPWQIKKKFGNRLNYLLHGSLGGANKPSEIRDLMTNKIIRHGE